jgi:hypothetical protein
MSVEGALLAVARELGKQIVRLWIGPRTAERERNSSLADLISVGVPDQIKRRKLQRQIEDISDTVAERLQPFCKNEFSGLPLGERTAAISAAAERLSLADLSDASYFAEDADPQRLAEKILHDNASWLKTAGLGQQGEALFRLVIRECSVVLTRSIQQLPAFTPRALQELLLRSSRISAEIAEVLDRVPRAALMSQRGTAFDGEFQSKYKSHLSVTQDQLELFGLDTRSYRLCTAVTTAFLSLNVSLEVWGDSEDRGAGKLHDEAITASRRIEAALRSNSRLLIRGDAGSGKTTLLQWLAVSAARGTFAAELVSWNGLTPFIIRLRSYSGRRLPRPEEFIDDCAGALSGLMPDGWVHRQLESGHALVLVDGVDEVQASERPRVKSWLRDLSLAYPDLKLVVTSRPAAATESWLSSEGFRSALVEPMDAADIDIFCTRWHDAVHEASVRHRVALPCRVDELPTYKRTVLRHLESRKHLRSLATNPLMCAMLCALNLDRRKHLPPDRMRIYADAIQLLLDRRDAERDIPSAYEILLTATQKLAVLQYLAWRVSESGRAELPKEEATAHVGFALSRLLGMDVDQRRAMDYLINRSGVLREPVPGRVDFIHRTFQEYLAAKECADAHAITSLIQKAHLDQWRETIIMAAGHVTGPHRDLLVNGILDRVEREPRYARRLRLLSAACLETMTVMSPELAGRIDEAIDSLVPPRAARESRSLALAGDRVLGHLPKTLDGVSEAGAMACIYTAAYVGGNSAIDVLQSYASDARLRVQSALQGVWMFFDAREYAREVLSNAPLLNWRGGDQGGVQIQNLEQLDALSELPNIASVHASLVGHQYLNLADLAGIQKLTSIYLAPATPVDLSPLRCHADLAVVSILGEGASTGFDALHELPNLQGLSVSLKHAGGGAVHSIVALPNLDDLEFYSAQLPGGAESVLSVLPELGYLGFTDCPDVESIDCLRGSNLTWLRLAKCPVQDLSPAMDLPNLRALWLEGAIVSDLGSVRNHRTIVNVVMYGNDLIDLSMLSSREVNSRLTIRLSRQNRANIRGVSSVSKSVKLKFA